MGISYGKVNVDASISLPLCRKLIIDNIFYINVIKNVKSIWMTERRFTTEAIKLIQNVITI